NRFETATSSSQPEAIGIVRFFFVSLLRSAVAPSVSASDVSASLDSASLVSGSLDSVLLSAVSLAELLCVSEEVVAAPESVEDPHGARRVAAMAMMAGAVKSRVRFMDVNLRMSFRMGYVMYG